MKTRVVKFNNGYLAQHFEGIFWPFGSWASYDKRRNGESYYSLQQLVIYCVHDTCSEAVHTLDLMKITELPE